MTAAFALVVRGPIMCQAFLSSPKAPGDNAIEIFVRETISAKRTLQSAPFALAVAVDGRKRGIACTNLVITNRRDFLGMAFQPLCSLSFGQPDVLDVKRAEYM